MKSFAKLIILMAITMIAASQLTLDLGIAGYTIKEGFWHVDIPVRGGVSPYIYSYQNFQTAWRQ